MPPRGLRGLGVCIGRGRVDDALISERDRRALSARRRDAAATVKRPALSNRAL